MPNSLLTINMITRAAVKLWKNSNAFIQNINTQYDDQYAINGAKIGDSLRIRLPNDYTVRTGAAVSVQNTAEQSTTMTMSTQKGVDVSFSSVDRTLSLQDYSERVMAPMVNNLAGNVAADVMQGSEGGVCNFVSNVDGNGDIITPNAGTVLDGGALLDLNSTPLGQRKLVDDPRTEARVIQSLSGLFNPQPEISKQYRMAKMYDALGFKWFMDQTVIKHTTGTFTAGTVNQAGQSGNTLVVNAITGTLNQGDIITIDGVFAVNRITKVTTGELRQFVITADALNGAVALSIYPAIVPSVGGNAVQYQTVVSGPANAAAINLVTKPGEVYRKNIAYADEMVTMVSADLEMPGPNGVAEQARESFDGISMRMITQYAIGTDQSITRLDVLYGFLYVRPEWGVIIADMI